MGCGSSKIAADRQLNKNLRDYGTLIDGISTRELGYCVAWQTALSGFEFKYIPEVYDLSWITLEDTNKIARNTVHVATNLVNKNRIDSDVWTFMVEFYMRIRLSVVTSCAMDGITDENQLIDQMKRVCRRIDVKLSEYKNI